MMKDICLELDEASDTLALIGEALGAAGVNIEGLCLAPCEGRHTVHLAVEEAVTAGRVLEESGIPVRCISDVLVLHKDEMRITGRPGSFGSICRMLAGHGIKIHFAYPAENNRYVFGVDPVTKARALFKV